MFENKRVLVTGATGLIGSHLVKRLLAEHATVIAMGRSEEKLHAVFRNELENHKISFLVGNISNALPVLGVLDYIYHAASPISGVEIRTMPVDTISANIDGARVCLEYLRKQGSGRMVLFSSATVYGNQLPNEISYSEKETANADELDSNNSPYSESKRMIEVLARAYYNQYGVDSVTVRIGYVYGFIDPSPNTAFYEFIGKAVNGASIVLNNSGMGRRDNIHVDDVVEGLILVAKNGVSTQAYNISSNGDLGNYCAIDEIALMIAETANRLFPEKEVQAIVKPFEGNRDPGMRLCNDKIKALGWNTRISLEYGIEDTVKRYMRLEHGE